MPGRHAQLKHGAVTILEGVLPPAEGGQEPFSVTRKEAEVCF